MASIRSSFLMAQNLPASSENRMHFFRSTLIGCILSLMFSVSTASASDETWGIFQLRKRMGDGQQIFAEYVRRDRGGLFTRRNLNLFRLSYGAKFEGSYWGYLVGAAFVDFESGDDERRLHQFAVYSRTFENFASVGGRFGFEQRRFTGDEGVYWRIRNRVQLNLLPGLVVGPSIYDEIFYAVDGRQRFSTGFNENRFGVGLRFHNEDAEIALYHTTVNVKTRRSEDRVEWLQFQTVISF